MKVSGSYQFDAPAAGVWEVLTDPKVLASCIPGCEGLDATGGDEYRAVMTVGVGPIRGSYDAKIALLDKVPPHSYRLAIEGSGGIGFVNGEAAITLVEQDGKTIVTVDGDSQAGGSIALVGQRLMGSVAQSMMNQFFNCLQRSIG